MRYAAQAMAISADARSLTLAPMVVMPSAAAYSQARARSLEPSTCGSGLVQLQKIDAAQPRQAAVQAASQRVERMVDERLGSDRIPVLAELGGDPDLGPLARRQRRKETAEAFLTDAVGGRRIEIAHTQREGPLQQP